MKALEALFQTDTLIYHGGGTGKAAQTGSQAGITRKLTGTVRIWDDPITYVYDTPGIMVPYFGEGEEAAEKGLKLALTCKHIR